MPSGEGSSSIWIVNRGEIVVDRTTQFDDVRNPHPPPILPYTGALHPHPPPTINGYPPRSTDPRMPLKLMNSLPLAFGRFRNLGGLRHVGREGTIH